MQMRFTKAVSLWIMLLCLFKPVALGQTGMDGSYKLVKGGISTSNRVTAAYRVAPGDILSFSIHEESAYDQEQILVRPDGYATIRPIGQVFVSGMSIKDLSQHLENSLTPYINDPQVFLSVQEFHTPRIYLIGAVNHPGTFQPDLRPVPGSDPGMRTSASQRFSNMDWTVSNLIIRSGGLTYNADISNIEIIKHNGTKEEANLFDFLINGDLSQDKLLEEGDTIQVHQLQTMPYGDEAFKLLCATGIYPERFPVRVLGEVEKPGLFYLSSDSPYINSAVAMASGYKRNALKRAVVINRKSNTQELARLVVDPEKVDLMLRPNDIVEVKDAQAAKLVRGAETFSRMVAPFWWISQF
jgi:protein involved in polysaccharide export with SLBB domain